jgi:hypothetical protein
MFFPKEVKVAFAANAPAEPTVWIFCAHLRGAPPDFPILYLLCLLCGKFAPSVAT